MIQRLNLAYHTARYSVLLKTDLHVQCIQIKIQLFQNTEFDSNINTRGLFCQGFCGAEISFLVQICEVL